jgi:hypothetical protein
MAASEMIIAPPKYLFLAISILLALLAVAFFLMGGDATRVYWRESGPVENVSALGYFAGVVAAALAAWNHRGLARWYLVLWAVFCFLCLGEETSWFQHFIGYQTPDAVAAHNIQREFNIHNLEVFHGGHLAQSENRTFATLLKAQILFQIGFAVFFFVIPILARLAPIKNLLTRMGTYIPSLQFIPFVWIPVGIALTFSLLSTGSTKDGLAELREMMFALFIGLFLLLVYLRTHRAASSSSAQTV